MQVGPSQKSVQFSAREVRRCVCLIAVCAFACRAHVSVGTGIFMGVDTMWVVTYMPCGKIPCACWQPGGAPSGQGCEGEERRGETYSRDQGRKRRNHLERKVLGEQDEAHGAIYVHHHKRQDRRLPPRSQKLQNLSRQRLIQALRRQKG